jgi:hypothetical protein
MKDKFPEIPTPDMVEMKKGKKQEIPLTPEMIEALIKETPEQEKKLEEVFGLEEATAKMIVELIKSERINLLTDLTFEEIQALTVAETFGNWIKEKFKCTVLTDICGLYKELKVSIGRRGRTEIIELGTFAGIGMEEKKMKLGGLLGGR